MWARVLLFGHHPNLPMRALIASGRIRFGVFELDLRSGELRKLGIKIKLHNQPFQVLATLLEHPGEVVTREQLRRKLWPADTFVDFDVGLNSAIKKLRDALGESAEAPRYVETLPRRGYRFIAPVEQVVPGTTGCQAAEIPAQGTAGVAKTPASTDQDGSRPLPADARRRGSRRIAGDAPHAEYRRLATTTSESKRCEANSIHRCAAAREPQRRPCAGVFR